MTEESEEFNSSRLKIEIQVKLEGKNIDSKAKISQF